MFHEKYDVTSEITHRRFKLDLKTINIFYLQKKIPLQENVKSQGNNRFSSNGVE